LISGVLPEKARLDAAGVIKVNTERAASPQVTIEEELHATYKNAESFNLALERLDDWVTPRCCGC
jgi:hypothetical protein